MKQNPDQITSRLNPQTLAVKQALADAGYRLPGAPRFDLPRLPPRVTDLTDDDLMELFTQLTRWTDHIAAQLSLHEVDERNTETAYENVWTLKLAANAPRSRSDGSVTVAKAETTQDPEVRAAKNATDMAYAYRKSFQAMVANLERDTNLVSRELTRRLGRAPNESRADRYRP